LTLPRHTTHESVADYIRKLILSGQLKPGQRILQEEFAVRLGVSRTPLREALHKLQSEGLITLSAHRGASVTDFSAEALREIYTVRIALEGYAAFLAAERITPYEMTALEEILDNMQASLAQQEWARLLELNRKFHLAVYASARQQRLYDLISNQIDLADVYRRIFVNLRPAEMVNHLELLVTLRNRQAAAAELLTRTHLHKSLAALLSFFENQPESENHMAPRNAQGA
jgi:DNA-binding GntR family transcriptional regulator